MAERFWSPIHLSDVLGPFTNPGDDDTANTFKLLNPNRGPMLIDQFRFSGLPTQQSLAQYACEIFLGSVPLMSGPITFGSFIARFEGFYAGLTNGLVSTPVAGPDVIQVFHLEKPLFVPQDVSVSIRVRRQPIYAQGTGTDPASTENIRCSIVGRSLPEGTPNPDKIWVPWISETVAMVNDTSFVSGDSDLINNHQEPLHVKAFLGVNYGGQGTSGYGPQLSPLTVQMTCSNGTAFVRDPVPFDALFPYDRGVLPVDAVLQPGEFMRCQIEVAQVPTGDVNAADAAVQFTSVGMVGYRQIQTPKSNT